MTVVLNEGGGEDLDLSINILILKPMNASSGKQKNQTVHVSS